MALSHTERLNVGYDGLNSSSDMIQDLSEYKQDLLEWFSENDAEYNITLHHEHSPEYGACLYYYSIDMEPHLSNSFRNFFL